MIDPALVEAIEFDQIGRAHYQMGEGIAVRGNRIALVGAPAAGLGAS